MENAIDIQGLKKSFGSKGKLVEAVRGVTLSVKQGEIYGFLGPNGAGKTTCQRMLTTLLPIDEGTARVSGFSVKDEPRKVREHIGYVGQLGGSDWEATGWENLLLAGQLYGMKRRDVKAHAEELVRLFDLKELTGRLVKTYSGGQRRRLEIALGIIHRPQVLFLDEPTTGLDPQNRANLWEHIRTLRNGGMAIFLTTHYLEEADELADRLAIMDYGRIVAEGTPQELKRQISGDVIVVKPKAEAHAEKLVKRFESREFVYEARRQGDSVHIHVKDGARALPLTFDLLASGNIELEKISMSQPTLDDVFLKQTGRKLRDSGKEQMG